MAHYPAWNWGCPVVSADNLIDANQIVAMVAAKLKRHETGLDTPNPEPVFSSSGVPASFHEMEVLVPPGAEPSEGNGGRKRRKKRWEANNQRARGGQDASPRAKCSKNLLNNRRCRRINWTLENSDVFSVS